MINGSQVRFSIIKNLAIDMVSNKVGRSLINKAMQILSVIDTTGIRGISPSITAPGVIPIKFTNAETILNINFTEFSLRQRNKSMVVFVKDRADWFSSHIALPLRVKFGTTSAIDLFGQLAQVGGIKAGYP